MNKPEDTPQRKTYPIEIDLPLNIYKGIGKVLSAHAILEQLVSEIVFELMKVDYKAGRTAFPYRAASTTLADLLTPLLVANPFSTIRASLRRRSSEEFEDGVTYGGQSWLGRRAVDSFFSALRLRGGDTGGRRRRSSS